MMKRRYILGSEWIYYKIYSGPKTLENILLNDIFPLVNRYLIDHTISSFFFIRYYDSDYHLRIRFKVSDISKILVIIEDMYCIFSEKVDSRIIEKIVLDTYKREVERYGGINIISNVEDFFFIDSLYILTILQDIYMSEDPDVRLISAIKSVDSVLSFFINDIFEKHLFYSELSKKFLNEYGNNRNVKLSIDFAYRSIKSKISLEDSSFTIFMKNNSNFYFDYANQVKSIFSTHPSPDFKDFFLSSVLHMHLNRVFRTNQRSHELYIYSFLKKKYDSLVSLKKNS